MTTWGLPEPDDEATRIAATVAYDRLAELHVHATLTVAEPEEVEWHMWAAHRLDKARSAEEREYVGWSA